MALNELFFQQMPDFPDLYLKHIYIEFRYPVLFTCCSNTGELYLVSCHRADAEKKEWIVTQIAPETIIEMLEDKKTIREPFELPEQDKYLVSLDASGQYQYQKVALSDIPTQLLPTAGCYMEAEPDEFAQEIEELSELCEYSERTFVQTWSCFRNSSKLPALTGIRSWTEKRPMMVSDEHLYVLSWPRKQVFAL